MSRKQHFDWIDVAKGMAILLVVIGHSFPDASAVGGVKNDYIRVLRDVIYQFHMPLLFFISGMLTGRALLLETLSDKCKYVKDRAKRLLVPYFTIAILYLPFKILLSRFANQPYDITGLWKILLGENPDGGLWFLYVLFLIQSTMCFFVYKRNLFSCLSVSLIISLLIAYLDTKWYWIDDAIFYMCFVIAGLWYAKSTRFGKNISLFQMTLLLVLFVISLMAFFETRSPYCKLFSGFGGSFLIIGTSKMIMEGSHVSGVLKTLGQYTMDIYIFHGILMVGARILFYSILGWNYYFCCTIMLTVGIIMPLVISKYIVRRVPVFRMLFLGESVII